MKFSGKNKRTNISRAVLLVNTDLYKRMARCKVEDELSTSPVRRPDGEVVVVHGASVAGLLLLLSRPSQCPADEGPSLTAPAQRQSAGSGSSQSSSPSSRLHRQRRTAPAQPSDC